MKFAAASGVGAMIVVEILSYMSAAETLTTTNLLTGLKREYLEAGL
jgi:hypothetical protein